MIIVLNAMAIRNQLGAKPLSGLDERRLLELDTTNMTPTEAASTISSWAIED